MAVVRSPVSRNRSLVRAVNRAAVASRNPANSSKSPDAKAASKADNRISVKYYSSVRSFIPPVQPGDFFTAIAMRDERQSNCAPAQDGKETRTFECVSGHREWMTVALH